MIVVWTTFNRLLRIEVQRYPAHWEADGSPIGYGMDPVPLSERKTWPTPFTTSICYYSWLFSNPLWAEKDHEALPLLRRMRSWSVVSHLGLLTGLIVNFFLKFGF